jgi:cell division protein FtsB
MNASIPYRNNRHSAVDVEAKVLSDKPFAAKMKAFLLVVVILVASYGVVSFFRIDSLQGENEVLATDVSVLTTRVATLEAEAEKFKTLGVANKKLRDDLDAEIARKKALAVENTNLKGRITQGERDLAQALEKLKLYERKQSKSNQKLKPKK